MGKGSWAVGQDVMGKDCRKEEIGEFCTFSTPQTILTTAKKFFKLC
jgi:hypothetical protein